MDQILVPVAVKLHIVGEQQAESCCSSHFLTDYFGYGKSPMQLQPFVPVSYTHLNAFIAEVSEFGSYAATVHSIVAYNDLAYFGGIVLHFVGTIPHVQVLPGSTWESHF